MNQFNNKKKVFIACLHLKHGGVEMAVSSLANALCQEGYSVELFCTYCLCPPAYPLDSRVKVRYLTNRRPNKEAMLQALADKNPIQIMQQGMYAAKTLWLKRSTMKRAFKQLKEGTVISTRHEFTRLLAKAGSKQVKKIAQIHQDHQYSVRLLHQIKKEYQKIDSIVLLTQQAKMEFEQLFSSVTQRPDCVVIPHFLSVLPPIEGHVQRKHQVITVGRLHPEKGLERMLLIWQQVFKDNPGWTLKIVGAGEQAHKLKSLCRQLCLEKSVDFVGELSHEQVLAEMQRSYCYLLTSYTESFGIAILEAMSCGLPVVAYQVRTGPKELITEGENGFLVEDGAQQAMVCQLKKLLACSSLRDQMGEQARKTAQRYHQDLIIQNWIELIEKS